MSEIRLHIVSFAIPDPPDYGGIIDVFYKVKYLAEAGVKIYLHCSQYVNRQPSKRLEEWCEKVWYYPRLTGVSGLSLTKPYIVNSRKDEALLRNLQAVDAPILFDGLSTTYYLNHPTLANRLKILRPQNVEQDYYSLLAKRTANSLKKIYYLLESFLLKKNESRLHAIDAFFTVAQHDHQFFKEKYPNATHEYIPSFQPYNEVISKEGMGEYCLYHGNLSVEENKEAALFLLDKVFADIDTPLIIAGKNPSEKLIVLVRRHKHCKLIANPDAATMEKLIVDAHIHVLPTFQNTGLKLKLLHALFHGRHVLVNPEMLEGTGLESVCTIAYTPHDFIEKTKELMKVPFDNNEINKRANLLKQHYDNRMNAQRIATYLQQISL